MTTPSAADLLADEAFRQQTKRLPAESVERFAALCCSHMETRHRWVMNSHTEPRQSETRETFDTLARQLADLRQTMKLIDRQMGAHDAFFRLAAEHQQEGGKVDYACRQLANKARPVRAFLEHGERFAVSLADGYTRHDGRENWAQPNAEGAQDRESVRIFSYYALECFGRPADAVVSAAAGFLMKMEIDAETVKKMRAKSREEVSPRI